MKTRQEQGTVAVEFVLIVPVLVCAFLLVVGLGRMAHARQQVEGVAADAARAASLERNTSQSTAVARSTAIAALGDRGVSCQNLDLNVDISDYRPGGTVRVQVSCTASLGDVALSGLPGQRVFTANAVVPIESYRSS